MKVKLCAVLLIIAAAFAAIVISEAKENKKNIPVPQTIEEARISFKAPVLIRREDLEEKTRKKLGKKIKDIFYFSAVHKKIEYLIYYGEYGVAPEIQNGQSVLLERFKDNNFKHTISQDKTKNSKTMRIDGTFEKRGKPFGIKLRLENKGKSGFWQIMTVYPYTEKNNKAAEEFMDSISFGSSTTKHDSRA